MITITCLGFCKAEGVREFTTKAGKPGLKLTVFAKTGKDEFQYWDALIFSEGTIGYLLGKLGNKNRVYLEGIPSVTTSEYKGKTYANKSIFVKSIEIFPMDEKALPLEKPTLNEVSQGDFSEDDIPF